MRFAYEIPQISLISFQFVALSAQTAAQFINTSTHPSISIAVALIDDNLESFLSAKQKDDRAKVESGSRRKITQPISHSSTHDSTLIAAGAETEMLLLAKRARGSESEKNVRCMQN
jgi:hypothetical protein